MPHCQVEMRPVELIRLMRKVLDISTKVTQQNAHKFNLKSSQIEKYIIYETVKNNAKMMRIIVITRKYFIPLGL